MSAAKRGGRVGPVACVLIPHFPWQTEVRRNPDLEGQSALIINIASNGSGRTVLDWSPDIEGVLSGMPLQEALSRNKGALIIEPDMSHYEVAFGRLLKALEERCPDVEDDGLGRAYIGIWGLEGLYGDDARVVQILANAIRQYDLRIGVGDNKWLAYAASLLSRANSGRKVTGEPGRFLDGFPVDSLPVPYQLIKRLHAFGLTTMGHIADIPRGPMEAQFGRAGGAAWELANGIDNRPLIPKRSVLGVSEHLDFPDPTASLATIVPALESLLGRAYGRSQLSRRFARQAGIQSQVFQHAPWTMRVAFKDPAGSKNHALFAIKSKLDTVTLPGPLEDMRLTLSGITGEAGRQESMWKDVKRDDDLREMISQLRARLKIAPPIYQVRELEPWSRIPERRYALVQMSGANTNGGMFDERSEGVG